MMNKLILFLLRKKLHVKKGQNFRYTNQKDSCYYYFDDNGIMKSYGRKPHKSRVSINWLLDDECKVITEW